MLSGSNEDCKIQGNNVASSCNVMKQVINYDKCFFKIVSQRKRRCYITYSVQNFIVEKNEIIKLSSLITNITWSSKLYNNSSLQIVIMSVVLSIAFLIVVALLFCHPHEMCKIPSSRFCVKK